MVKDPLTGALSKSSSQFVIAVEVSKDTLHPSLAQVLSKVDLPQFFSVGAAMAIVMLERMAMVRMMSFSFIFPPLIERTIKNGNIIRG